MRVFNGQYTTIDFTPENKLCRVVRSVPPGLGVDAYKQGFLKWLEVIVFYKPTQMILIEEENRFPIRPELQEWINRKILLPAYEAGLRRIAFVVSKELIVSLSQEQVMEEDVGSLFQTAYFGKAEDAEQWILQTQGLWN